MTKKIEYQFEVNSGI